MLCQPDSGEMALEVVDQTVRSSAVDIICVDSVAALVPRAEIEGEMGAHQGDTDAHTPQHVIPAETSFVKTVSLHSLVQDHGESVLLLSCVGDMHAPKCLP